MKLRLFLLVLLLSGGAYAADVAVSGNVAVHVHHDANYQAHFVVPRLKNVISEGAYSFEAELYAVARFGASEGDAMTSDAMFSSAFVKWMLHNDLGMIKAGLFPVMIGNGLFVSDMDDLGPRVLEGLMYSFDREMFGVSAGVFFNPGHGYLSLNTNGTEDDLTDDVYEFAEDNMYVVGVHYNWFKDQRVAAQYVMHNVSDDDAADYTGYFVEAEGSIMGLTYNALYGAQSELSSVVYDLGAAYNVMDQFMVRARYHVSSGDDDATGDVNESFVSFLGEADFGVVDLFEAGNMVVMGAGVDYKFRSASAVMFDYNTYALNVAEDRNFSLGYVGEGLDLSERKVADSDETALATEMSVSLAHNYSDNFMVKAAFSNVVFGDVFDSVDDVQMVNLVFDYSF